MQIKRMRVKKGQRPGFFQTKKIQNIVKNIFQNKIANQKECKSTTLGQVKKERKRTEKNRKNAESFTK